MDFDLTEEHLALQAMVRKFTEREIEPIAARIDRDGTLPDDLANKMAGVGLFGITAPRAYGGTQGKLLDTAIACEEVARSGTGAWWLIAFANSVSDCIAQFGSEYVKRRYIPPICVGTAYPSVQFTEEDTGSDPGALTTTAIPAGDHYVIDGMKRFSTFGARDGCAILYAKDETGRCSCFVVDKNSPGYTVSKTWELMGSGGAEAVDVILRRVRIPAANLLGSKGDGFGVLLHWIAVEKIEQCAACVGIAQAAFDEATKYSKSRRVKNNRMSSLQGIRWMLADLKPKLVAARLVTQRAAFLADRRSAGWQAEAAAAKLFVVPAAIEITETARRLHGAYGYTREFKIEMLSRAVAGAATIATSLEVNRSLVGASVVEG